MQHSLHRVHIDHNTYHHFVGKGEFDSKLDVIIFSNFASTTEEVNEVICKHTNPLVNSHHDLIVSSFFLPVSTPPPPSLNNITAPRVHNDRQKVMWSDEGFALYKDILGSSLVQLRQRWQEAASSPSIMSVLLSSTYSLFQVSAASSNSVINLGKTRAKKIMKSHIISRLQRDVLRAQHNLESVTLVPSVTPVASVVRAALTHARGELTRATRAQIWQQNYERDSKLATSDFSSLFKSIKSSKSSSAGKISSIRVGEQVYKGDTVPDGFFHSMHNLKHPDMGSVTSSPHFRPQALTSRI